MEIKTVDLKEDGYSGDGLRVSKSPSRSVFKLIMLSIVFLPFIGIGSMIKAEFLMHGLQVLSSFVLTVMLVADYKNIRFNALYVILLLFSGYELFGAVYNGTVSFGILFSIYFRIISIVYIIKSYEKKDYLFVKVLSILLNILIIINIPSLISSMSLSEYEKVFLVGGKNSLAILAISSIFFSYLNRFVHSLKMSKFNYLMIIINLMTLLLCGSSTGLVIGIIMLIFVFFGERFYIRFRYYAIIYAVALFLVLNTNFIENLPILHDFITESLNKNLTFTGRTAIWNNSIKYISNNFWGYGRGNEIVLMFTGSVNECHNAMLELLLASGVPGLLLFIIFLFECVKTRNRDGDRKILNICFFTIFAFFMLGLTESIVNNIIFWWVMSITFCEGTRKRTER